jgi:DNA-binding HxlR family transcriptional regulator
VSLGPGRRTVVGVTATYGQFCPVSKAADVLCQRWALLVIREVLSGSSRFRDLQRGLPGCPPATLAKRLKELEAAGVLSRTGGGAAVSYGLTEAGGELYPIVEGFGVWGQRWARSSYGPDELDAETLLWDMRRLLDPAGPGGRPAVLELRITSPDLRPRRFWMVADGVAVDLCLIDPERPVDLLVESDLRALTEVWMGDVRIADAIASGTITLTGPQALVAATPGWIGRHPVLGSVPPAR